MNFQSLIKFLLAISSTEGLAWNTIRSEKATDAGMIFSAGCLAGPDKPMTWLFLFSPILRSVAKCHSLTPAPCTFQANCILSSSFLRLPSGKISLLSAIIIIISYYPSWRFSKSSVIWLLILYSEENSWCGKHHHCSLGLKFNENIN